MLLETFSVDESLAIFETIKLLIWFKIAQSYTTKLIIPNNEVENLQ